MKHVVFFLLVALSAALVLGRPVEAQSGNGSSAVCVGDANGDAAVTVDELVQAVNNGLVGCGFEPLQIEFRAVVGTEPFACGTLYSNVGTTASDFIPADLRFYVSDVRLLNESGEAVPVGLEQDGIWQYESIALLDFENKQPPCNQGTVPVNTSLRGSVPPGQYRGLRFTVGVPFALNHGNAATAPSPLNLTSMFWNWQAGYKFFRVDEGTDAVRVHVGSTGCRYGDNPNMVEACTRQNRAEIFLPDFDPASSVVVVDLAELFADSDLTTNQPDTSPGCESSPLDSDCEPIFRHLGVNFANGLPDPSHQTVFRVAEQ